MSISTCSPVDEHINNRPTPHTPLHNMHPTPFRSLLYSPSLIFHSISLALEDVFIASVALDFIDIILLPSTLLLSPSPLLIPHTHLPLTLTSHISYRISYLVALEDVFIVSVALDFIDIILLPSTLLLSPSPLLTPHPHISHRHILNCSIGGCVHRVRGSGLRLLVRGVTGGGLVCLGGQRQR